MVLGQAGVSLESELETAGDLFERLGVRLEVAATPVVDERTQTLVAGVLREAVTNMFKHSRPRCARITVTDDGASARLSVINDGAALMPTSRSAEEGGSGTGLFEHSRNLARAGGRLTSGLVGDEHFEVVAVVPCDAGPTNTEANR